MIDPIDSVTQGIRTYLKGVLRLTDLQVIPANKPGARPPLPYLTVQVLSDVGIGEDELIGDIGVRINVGAGVEDDEYTIAVDGEDLTYTRTADDTNATVAAGLAALILASLGSAESASPVASVFEDPDDPGVFLDVVLVDLGSGIEIITSVDPKITVVDDAPLVLANGARRATVSIRGFGPGAASWLNRARAQLPLPRGVALCNDAGLALRFDSAVQDLSAVLDSSIEGSYLLEGVVVYTLTTDFEAELEVETLETAATFESDVKADRSDTIILTVED